MPKRGQLARIHIAKRELGLDEATYRQVLRERYRHDSSVDLSEGEALDLIEHFRRLGWRPRRGPRRPVSRAQIGLMHVLWRQLAEAGALAHPDTAALLAFVRHATGKEALARLNVREAGRVIERLKQWLERLRAAEKTGGEG